MKQLPALGLALLWAWLWWSGHTELLLLSAGVTSCLVVVVLAARMGVADEEGVPLGLLNGRGPAYGLWLAWQIARANLDVARRILHPGLPIGPRLVRVPAAEHSDVGRVIYANSITLTPGTISVEVGADGITVHALSREAAEALATGEMGRRVGLWERSG